MLFAKPAFNVHIHPIDRLIIFTNYYERFVNMTFLLIGICTRILLSQCNAQMKISFSGLIFAQYKSIKLILLLLLLYTQWTSSMISSTPFALWHILLCKKWQVWVLIFSCFSNRQFKSLAYLLNSASYIEQQGLLFVKRSVAWRSGQQVSCTTTSEP